MRAKPFALFIVVLGTLTACTQPSPTATQTPHRARGPADLLVLGSSSGLVSLDVASGATPFTGPGVPSSTDWSTVFTASHADGTTVLRAIRTATGQTLSTTLLPGDLDVRVAAPNGDRVALMDPLPPGVAPWSPGPRAWTNLVLADPSNARKPMRFHLKGNFEPEAFSADASRLFMISYVPPTHPTAYRVVGLDPTAGKVYPLIGRQKQWVGAMTGTRLMQVPAPNGGFLFTLYSSQPPKYARGYDDTQAAAGRPVAFVHTLNLELGQAVCVGLPRVLWGGNPAYEAIAASPADSRVYVVDTSRGVVAVLSSETLRVIQTARVAFGLPAVGTQTQAAISRDGGSLFVSTGSAIVTLDAMSLVPTAKWNAPQAVSGVGVSDDGTRLYVAMPGEVEAVKPSSGTSLLTMRVAGVDAIHHVGSLGV
jgi:hypothetical protein